MDPEAAGAVAAVASSRLRIVIALATALMLVLSWPLWIESDSFPRVPFLQGLPELPAGVSWVFYGLVLSATGAAASPLRPRTMLGISVLLLLLLVLQDQERFQPWVYQYLVVGLLLATLGPSRALRYSRGWFAALYFHSGLSKLDVSFRDEMGALLLTTGARLVRLEPSTWPASWRTAAILAMPITEIAIALALVIPATRKAGMAGAIAVHATLLAILGPFGLRHSPIVLIWNAAAIIEVAIAFGPDLAREPAAADHDAKLAPLVQLLFWAGLILPFGERRGLFDSWPAHALYASHVERSAVFLHEDERKSWPESIRRHLAEQGPGPWRRLDLTGWSRAMRAVPIYPQGRTCNGLAEALAARYGDRRLIRVIHWSRADRWTGQRAQVECFGLDAIRRQAARYPINAHPSGAFLHPRERTGQAGYQPAKP